MTSEAKRAKESIESFSTAPLFPELEPTIQAKIRRYKRIQQPIWTENKARFVQRYLEFFVQVTKHGAYIDGFAGPQYFDKPDAWAAALVLESKPKWLRKFFLCELTKRGVTALKRLVKAQPEPRDRKGRKLPRTIEVWPGDFNVNVETILKEGGITQKEATFCLLDQRTFECHWATLKRLAAYKEPPNNKIELLYFLGVGWIHRAISGIRNKDKLSRWWGKPDWIGLKLKTSWELAELVRKRFQDELGYRFSAAYPIYDKKASGKVMYYMIHASDHDEAPALMVRAHHKAVRSLPREVQRPLSFESQ
jgi:three-Cys-motif partner protein